MRELEYPFDSDYLLKKSKSIRRRLYADGSMRITKKIAVLGGSTTHDIIRLLELFLLDCGIAPAFYESEYARYWEDAMFPNRELEEFAPDIIYIHTSSRNISGWPEMTDTQTMVQDKLISEYAHFETMWKRLEEVYRCPVIQNNFEYPFYRLLGNRDGVDCHGRLRFVNSLNEKFYAYAGAHENFHINDIAYLAASFGLEKWSDVFYWHMYKYACSMSAIPELAFNLCHIIKAVYGKNKKSLVLDLDNTLWGGIVGDDGPENIEIGQETSTGQVYSEFQQYIRAHKNLGVLLNVNSKNEESNALAGLTRPDGSLRPEDFIIIKANWEPKSRNLEEIAAQLNILPDSLVFVDDNPAERELVKQQVPGAAVPEIGSPEEYIRVLDRSGFFEVTNLSEDDRKRSEMYQANAARAVSQAAFADYEEYLKSLSMKAVIRSFEPMYMARTAQLTNKSNQFNLTTKRYSQAELEEIAADGSYLTLYGRLEDKFGDNGVVSIVIGRQETVGMHIELWLMSCRVLKRDMELAMLDSLVEECTLRGVEELKGYYYPTPKNAMVKDFYADLGFTLQKEDENGNRVWYYKIDKNYEKKNRVIAVTGQGAASDRVSNLRQPV